MLNHWLALNKGDSIEFEYMNNWWGTEEYPTNYYGTVSANRQRTFENGTSGMHTYIINLFECVDIDTDDCQTFQDYFKKLEKVFSDPTIGYVDIYKKKE
jgi:hypothetical protein